MSSVGHTGVGFGVIPLQKERKKWSMIRFKSIFLRKDTIRQETVGGFRCRFSCKGEMKGVSVSMCKNMRLHWLVLTTYLGVILRKICPFSAVDSGAMATVSGCIFKYTQGVFDCIVRGFMMLGLMQNVLRWLLLSDAKYMSSAFGVGLSMQQVISRKTCCPVELVASPIESLLS